MVGFMGGSAPAMASQIADGFILVNTATLKGYLPNELQALRQELEKVLRDTRSLVPPSDDALQQQARHRKIARVSSAVQMVQARLSARGH
jgi:hypothetical protein